MFNPLIVDPETYDKKVAFMAALEQCFEFMKINDISPPKELHIEPQRHLPKLPWEGNGWCTRSGSMYVNLNKSATPVKNPGFRWSYTGFKADLTAPGVLAHEVAHHVKWRLEKKSKETKTSLLQALSCVAMIEAPVSSYEPDLEELWAEAGRLFILNPDLLLQGRPKRYAVLHAVLDPVHDLPWREVLKNAHPRIIAAAENWIKKTV